MIIHCTKKLLDQLKIKPELAIDEEPLFSWHANLITLNRKKTVVLVNDKNRYIMVLYGLKAKDFKALNNIIINAIRETFNNECIKDEVIEEYLGHSGEIIYSKTKDRTSISRMNNSCEFVYIYQELLKDDAICQSTISKKASNIPAGFGKNKYEDPNELLYKDLEEFAGKPIFSCKAVVLNVKLNLINQNVWRRLVVPVNITFDMLHKILQNAFGWLDYHMHEFFIYENEKSENIYSSPDYINHPAFNKEGYKPVVNLVADEEAFDFQDEIPIKLENGIKLSEYLLQYKKLKYIYDFGDYWQHYIEVAKIIDNYDKNYPVCIDGKGNTPPEDVGGASGYDDFLQIISDKSNPEYKETIKWAKSLNYCDFDILDVNRNIKFTCYSGL